MTTRSSILAVDVQTGQIHWSASGNLASVEVPNGCVPVAWHEPLDGRRYYFDLESGEPVDIGVAPSAFHVFDYAVKEWCVDARGAARLLAERATAIHTRRNARLQYTITIDGIAVDGDDFAQRNVADTLRDLDNAEALGMEVPQALLFWIDAANQRHEWPDVASYREWLRRYSIALTQRKALLISAARAKKDALAAMGVDELLAYDATTDWPDA